MHILPGFPLVIIHSSSTSRISVLFFLSDHLPPTFLEHSSTQLVMQFLALDWSRQNGPSISICTISFGCFIENRLYFWFFILHLSMLRSCFCNTLQIVLLLNEAPFLYSLNLILLHPNLLQSQIKDCLLYFLAYLVLDGIRSSRQVMQTFFYTSLVVSIPPLIVCLSGYTIFLLTYTR